MDRRRLNHTAVGHYRLEGLIALKFMKQEKGTDRKRLHSG